MKDENKYHEYLNGSGDKDTSNDELTDFLETAGKVKPPTFKKSKQQIWDQIDQSIEESDENDARFSITNWIGIAASLVLIAGLSFYFLSSSTEQVFTSDKGETKEVTLPDGSTVTLNAVSKISFNSSFQDRLISLEGEAFFQVKKGKTFTVNTTNGSVKVLGTSFNVVSRDETFKVACKTGKVSVDVSNQERFKTILSPGKSLIKDVDTIMTFRSPAELIGQWQTGEFYFNERPVTEVLNEMKRQYNVEISGKQIGNRTFSGYFIGSDLETALSMVCEPLGLSYSIIDKKHIVVTTTSTNPQRAH